MTLSTVLRMGSGFVVFVLIARSLGAEPFGLMSYWMAIAGLATLPVNYGFGLQLLREVGADASAGSAVMVETLVAKLVLSVAVVLAAVCVPLFVQAPMTVFLPLLLMFIVESFAEHANFLLRAREKFDAEAVNSVIASLLSIPLIAGTAMATARPEAVCGAFLLSRVVSAAMAFWAARGLWSWNRAEAFDAVLRVGSILKRGFSYATDVLVGAVNSTLDSILVGAILGVRPVGLYQAGMKLFQGFTALAPVVSYVYLPQLAANDKNGLGDRFNQTANAMMRKLLLVGGGGAVILAVRPGDLSHIVYGKQFEELAVLLPWFALALLLKFVAATFGVVLTAVGMQARRAAINAISVAILALLIVLFGREFGVKGVLMALVASSAFTSIGYWWVLRSSRIPAGMSGSNCLIAVVPLALCAWRIWSE